MQKEFELLVLTIAKTLSDTNLKAAAYHWSDFKEMAKRIRNPLKTVIEDQRVVLNDVGCAIMMREAAIDVLKEKVLVGEKRSRNATEDSSKKWRHTGSGNTAVDTEFGATCHTALSSSERRDLQPNKQAQEKCEKDLKTEKAFIEKNLAMVQERKRKTEAANRTARELWERTRQQHETGVQARQPTVNGLPGDHQLQGPLLTEASLSGSGNEDT
jgi:hypothetical protein